MSYRWRWNKDEIEGGDTFSKKRENIVNSMHTKDTKDAENAENAAYNDGDRGQMTELP